MADITLTVDVSSLEEAQKKVKNFSKSVKDINVGSLISGVSGLESRIKQLVDAQKKGTIGLDTYKLGLLEIKRSYEQLGFSSQKATQMVRSFAAQLQQQQALKEAARAAEEAGLATKRLADRHYELRLRFQDGFADNQRYRKSVDDLKEAYRVGIIPTLEVYKQKLRELRAAQSQAVGNIRGNNGMGVAIQQLGYQVGDFAVQVQSGTNAFVAFGQQATQLVGVLPLIHRQLGITAMRAIGISTVLGIAIPIITAFGAAWLRSKQQAEEAKKALDPLEERLKSIDNIIKNWNFENQAKIFNVSPDIYAATEQLNKLEEELKAAQKNYASVVGDLITQYGEDFQISMSAWAWEEESKKIVSAQGDVFDAMLRIANLRIKMFDDSRSMTNQELVDLRDRVALAQTELRFGEDSIQYRKAQADIERRIYQERLEAKGVLEEHVDRLMDAYDATKNWEAMAKQVRSVLSTIDGMKLKVTLSVDAIANNLPDMLKGFWQGAKEAAFRNFEQFPVGVPSRAFTAPPKAPSMLGEPEVPKTKDGGAKKEQEDYLKSLLQEAEYKRSIVGLSEEDARRREIIYELTKKGLEVDDARIKKVLEAEAALRKATEAEENRKNMIENISNKMEDAFMSMIDGSKSVGDAFKGMIREILLDIYRQQVAKPLASGISDLLGGFLGGGGLFGGASWSANGNVVGRSGIQAFANGGVVGSATMFRHGGGLGVMGESGPEAIMPLKRGKDGKLGVQMSGGSGTVVVNQSFNFSANGDESVKKIIAQAAPKIAEMTQKQIIDSRRRGGAMKATFG